MTIKELAKHFAPDFRYKIKDYSSGVVVEVGDVGDIQDEHDDPFLDVTVKDFTMYHSHLEIML